MDVPRILMGHGTGKDIGIAVSHFGGTILWMCLGLLWDGEDIGIAVSPFCGTIHECP